MLTDKEIFSKGHFQCLRSERYVIVVKSNIGRFKILQIIFDKRDGSLYVNFPYYLQSEGIVCLVPFPPSNSSLINRDIKNWGKATSHLVKYVHHISGEAHFSQDGKVFTSIRKNSMPLNKTVGHIFSVTFQGIKYFERADAAVDIGYKKKRTVIDFSANEMDSETLKIVGRWYHLVDIERELNGTVKGPIVPVMTSDGKMQQAFVLGHPYEIKNRDYVLLVTCEPISKINQEDNTTLVFIGGFDSPEIVNNLFLETSCLLFSYPQKNFEELKQLLGTIDLRPKL